MREVPLDLRYDRDERSVWIEFQADGALVKDLVRLRAGFELQHVREALLATGLVQRGDRLLLISDDPDLQLGALVEQIFSYFELPERPRVTVQQVQAAVHVLVEPRAADPIPLWAYAWLDISVREELADSARAASRIWSDAELVLPLEQLRSVPHCRVVTALRRGGRVTHGAQRARTRSRCPGVIVARLSES